MTRQEIRENRELFLQKELEGLTQQQICDIKTGMIYGHFENELEFKNWVKLQKHKISHQASPEYLDAAMINMPNTGTSAKKQFDAQQKLNNKI